MAIMVAPAWRLALVTVLFFRFTLTAAEHSHMQRTERRAEKAMLHAGMRAGMRTGMHAGMKVRGGNAVLTKPMMLLMSSPMEMKIVYTQIENFKAMHNDVQPLIDAGLSAPYGIALDQAQMHLYVSDLSAQKIFMYNILLEAVSDFIFPHKLTVNGERIVVVEGVESRWLTCHGGELYFSDEKDGSIKKLTEPTLRSLHLGAIHASDLVSLSEVSGEAIAEAGASEALSAAVSMVDPMASGSTSHTHSIITLYQAGSNPHVGNPPGGMVVDGQDLFFVNNAEGTEKGTVIQGSMNPQSPVNLNNGSGAGTFETFAMTSNLASAWGITETYNMIMYTTGARQVFGIPRGGGEPVAMSEVFESSRGAVWDGDSTVYIADQGASTIYTLPCGRIAANQPVGRAVDFHDVFGLAVLHLGGTFSDTLRLRALAPLCIVWLAALLREL